MNKKIIVFICIISLLVPFLPQFDFDVHAYVDTTSQNSFIQNLVDLYQTYFGSNGVVVNSDWYNSTYPQGLLNDICDNLGLEPIDNDFGSAIYDYSVVYNQTADMIFNDTSQYVEDLVNEMLGYYIYNAMPVDKFFNFYNFSGLNSQWLTPTTNFINYLKNNICVSENTLYIMCTDSSNMRLNDGVGVVGKLSFDVLNEYSFYLDSGNFGDFPNYQYQSMIFPISGVNSLDFSGRLKMSNGESFFTSYGRGWFWNGSNKGTWYDNQSIGLTDFYPIMCGVQNNFPSFNVLGKPCWGGTLFLTSGQDYAFPVFKSRAFIWDFYHGNASVYKFNSSLSIPQGADIDYSRLYDIISTEVLHSSGNVIDAINGVANDYLHEQLDLLHDINNALNDGSGHSWLRRIYVLLDYNFPLTLQAFDDLRVAVENISISGGGSDLTHINRVLDEINDKLGFMIEEPLTNADIEDMNDLKNLAQQKFPFCVFSDIVAISVVLNQTPEQPHWIIPLKLPGSSSVNNIEIDLSWYEDVRPVVQGVFIFIFIVGLLALSVKVFSALKS